MKKKFKYNKEGFCDICDYYVEECDTPHYCEVYNDTLEDVIKRIEEIKCDIPKKPMLKNLNITPDDVDDLMKYAGRVNYNKALNDLIKEIK
jgi:hypothetical protein